MGTPEEQIPVHQGAWHCGDGTTDYLVPPGQMRDSREQDTRFSMKLEIDGSDVNTRQRGGETDSYAAVANEALRVRALLKEGADIEAKHDKCVSALNLACKCESGGLEVVDFSLAHGADIESEMVNGDRPLHSALNSKNEPLAALLIRAGADVNAHGANGRTPLHIAAIHGLENTTKSLLGSGADIEATDDGTWTPLHLTCGYGSIGVLELLLSKGANVNYRDEDNWAALHQAVNHNRVRETRLVLDAGADVNIRTTDTGLTPLQMAARHGYEDIVKSLIASGAEIEARNREGSTALHLAVVEKNGSVVETLIRAGAVVQSKSADGSTVAHLAAKLGDQRIVQILVEKGPDLAPGDLDDLKAIQAAAKLLKKSPDLETKAGKGAIRKAEDKGSDQLCNVSAVMSFKYDALPSKRSLRLLRFLPNEDDVSIKCTLSAFDFDGAPPFQALSYHWGSPDAPRHILLNESNFKVTQNLWDFLKVQQREEDPFLEPSHYRTFFWIDAICVDQTNVHERNSQVAFMNEIYKAAARVIVWLGPGSDEENHAMLYLKHGRVTGKELVNPLDALRGLFDGEYWRRTWIVQEFVLANDIEIRCGDRQIDLRTFGLFCSRANKGLYDRTISFRDTSPFALWKLRRATRRLPLYELLIQNRDRKCSIIHDKIYAMLGLANDCLDSPILKTDYEKPLEQLFCEVMQLSKFGPEYAICFAQFLVRLLGLPDSRPPTFYLRPPNRSYRAGDLTFVDANAWIRGNIVHAERLLVGGQTNTESDFDQLAETLGQRIVTFLRMAESSDKSSHALLQTSQEVVKLMRKRWYDFRTSSEGRAAEARDRCVLWTDMLGRPRERKYVGFATGDVRDGDCLCQFDSIECALILRRRGGRQYLIVGDAYLLDAEFQGRIASQREEYFTGEPLRFGVIQPHQCSRLQLVNFRWNTESQLEGYHPQEPDQQNELEESPLSTIPGSPEEIPGMKRRRQSSPFSSRTKTYAESSKGESAGSVN
jgi:ankyrin repeat protein